MRRPLLVVNSVVGAVLLTLTTVVATLLYLMFSQGDDLGRREGLFGSAYFEVSEVREGVTGASMGVENPVGPGVMFVFYLLFLTAAQVVYVQLKNRRAHLLKERSNI
jgi:hypothetical protein